MGIDRDFEVREFEVAQTPPSPSIIGHEFVGHLEDLDTEEGQAYGLKAGDAVIADIAVPCGDCLLCRSGDDANCANMKVTNGGSVEEAPYLYCGYTEVNFTPLANLIRIPDELNPVVAVTFACPGPTAIHACRLAEQAGVRFAGMGAAVVQGLGPVGCFALAYLKKAGIENIYAITVGDNSKREELAMELGAKRVFNLDREGTEAVTAALQKENSGLGVDLCFEASGVVQGMDVLRNRGVYLVPGQYSASGGITIQPQTITFKALHIIGSSQYSVIDVEQYLNFLIANKDLHPLIDKMSSRYPIERINEAIEDAKSGNNIKTLLV